MAVIPLAPAQADCAAQDVTAYLRPGTLNLPALPPLSLCTCIASSMSDRAEGGARGFDGRGDIAIQSLLIER